MAYLLVADDNEMNRDMLSRRLQRQGYEVAVASDGVEAIEQMQTQNFDLVLLDLMMPNMNGYEVLEHVKADDRLRDVPIIMISAVDELDSVVRCIELGAEDYLFKPFNPVLLRARISSSLERRNKHQQDTGGLSPQVKPAFTALVADIRTLAAGEAGELTPEQTALVNQLVENTKRLADLLDI